MNRRDTPPPSNSRRRFLVAAGFGAANVVLATQLGKGSRGGADNTPRTVDLVSGETIAVPTLGDAPPALPSDHIFDLLVTNARVIDPETGFDAVAEIGINDGVITAIQGPGGLAYDLIDAGGQVVSPGFIDILSAEPNDFGEWLKVADGVTTNFAMHGVNSDADAFFDRYTGVSPVHFGGSFNQHLMRARNAGVGPEDPLTEPQLASLVELARINIANGLAGVSFTSEYSPGTTVAEVEALATLCAEVGHDTFHHVRYSDPDSPGTGIEAVQEALGIGRRIGVGVHIEHIGATGGTFAMRQALDMIEAARVEGIDATACIYPYDSWSTTLGSFRFVGDWQTRYRVGVDSLQVVGTEGRLDAATFATATEQNKFVVAHGAIPEDEVQMALQTPWMMIGSDAILTRALNNHPRASGTFARTLGRYVRELGILDLRTALAKMTVQPADRLVSMVPEMAKKGRLQVGADADLTIFDPATVADAATAASPGLPSVGISSVLVAGEFVMRDGETQRGNRPGQALRSTIPV